MKEFDIPREVEPDIVPMLDCPGGRICICTDKKGMPIYHSPYWKEEYETNLYS